MQNETLRAYKIWFDCCIVGSSVAYDGAGDISRYWLEVQVIRLLFLS